MGRRKISIAPIKDDRNRQVTFLKRKNGLFKKAYELGVLCSADVAVIVFNANGKLFEFHSGDMDAILLKYSHYAGPPHEKRGPEDYVNKDLDAATKRGMGGKMTNMTDDDDDDDDDEKPLVATGSSGVRVLPQASRGKQAIRAAAERKAKEAERSRGPSEEVGGPEASGSGSNSFAGQGATGPSHDHLPNLNGLPQPSPSAQQPPQLPQLPSLNFASNAGGLPSLTSQQPGLPQTYANTMPFGVSASPITLPSWAAAAAGLPVSSFGFSLPAGVSGWPAPSHFPSAQPSSANAGAGGVPAWFAGAGQMQMSTAQALQGQLVQAPLQFLQQLGGVPGWPPGTAGMLDPNAALQAFQQQQQQHHHHHPQPGYQDVARPQSGSATQPTPAPMYGTPASMPPPPAAQHNTPPVYAEQSHQDMTRPSSVASMASTTANHSTPHHGHSQPNAPTRSNSLNSGSKPRLSVAIPAETVHEGTKPGLVTAGGASILGAGLAARGGHTHAQLQPMQEGNENNNMPRSAFASDLLPSPFYPNPVLPGFGTTFLLPSAGPTTTQVFQWPSAVSAAPPPPAAADSQSYRPAPMLGQEEAPDLLRRRSSEQSGNGLADLTQAAAALEGDADARGVKRGSREEEHEGGGAGGGEEGGEGDEAGAKKRRAT
ncbi:SRF-type transcription factor RlmA [Rhodotorula toruloides]|uniref:SRF-type transcription factor RlmA n=1 Tax=Rhodotorula toruloides TaxID=5286 RepID=A0A511KB12_RHOTO|nr:SRF-type transcription factor RlmA [Rhodotorula toruloides]